jgi:hypothetical protein
MELAVYIYIYIYIYIKEYKQTERDRERGVEELNYNAGIQKINSRILAVEGVDILNTWQ